MTLSSSEKKSIPDHVKLLRITDNYLVDLECLREMFATVTPVLQQQDKERHEEVKTIVMRLQSKIDIYKQSDEQTKESTTKELEDSSRFDDVEIQSLKKALENSFIAKDLELLQSNIKKLWRARNLFAEQTIVAFVSRFDEFLGSILEIALTQNPEWLKESEKVISYKELIALKSIDTAIKGVVLKEVEQLLRGSHEEQISYLDKKLKLGIQDNFPYLPGFLEVAERRNLFVHTGGQVSAQYLDRCQHFKHSTSGIKEGDKLEVTKEYFENAFSIFFEIGLRIGQATFRRLFSTEFEMADRALIKLSVKFLNYGENELAEIITNYDLNISTKLRSKDSEDVYFARINRAIAQKRQGKDFEAGLEGVRWQAFHSKYKLCLHVLRDEFKDAAILMHSSDVIDKVGIEGFRTWPVFKEFRSTSIFREAYRSSFGHDYLPDLERDAATIARQEEVLDSESELPLVTKIEETISGDAEVSQDS
jgi:hypothetical protein